MAIQTKTVTLAAAATGTFIFTKPAGNYGKTPGVTPSGADAGAVVAVTFAADVDNGNGTMTGTANLDAAITGTVEIIVYDRV